MFVCESGPSADQAVFPGLNGLDVPPDAAERRSALFGDDQRPAVYDFVAGISGRDVAPADYIKMVDKAEIEIEGGNKNGFEIYGVRG